MTFGEDEQQDRATSAVALDLPPFNLFKWLCVAWVVCSRLRPDPVSPEFTSDPRAPADWPREIDELEVQLRRLPEARNLRPAKDFAQNLNVASSAAKESKKVYSEQLPWNQLLLASLNRLRASSKKEPLSFAQLMKAPLTSAPKAAGARQEELSIDAINRFREWLLGDEIRRIDDLGRLHAEVYLDVEKGKSSDRVKQCEQIVRQLVIGDPNAAQTLLNVHAASNLTGLRAFATHMVLRMKQRMFELAREKSAAGGGSELRVSHQIIYVPLSRAMVHDGDVSRNQVIAQLTAALCDVNARGEIPDSGAGREGSDRPDGAMRLLRRMLTLHPTIIVFAGLEVSPPPIGAIFDVLKHSDWITFIKQLIQPCHESLAALPHMSYRSRFLLLSNEEIPSLRPWMMQAPQPLKGFASRSAAEDLLGDGPIVLDRWTSLRAEIAACWPDVRASPVVDQKSGMGLQQTYRLQSATNRRLVEIADRLPPEIDLALEWCAHKRGRESQAPADSSWAAKQAARFATFRHYIRGAEADAGDRLALQFIALAMDGLRVSTLLRCLGDYLGIVGHSDDVLSIKRTIESLQSHDSIEQFQKKHEALLVLGKDSNDEIDDARRWFELQSRSDGYDVRQLEQEGRIFDLRLVELRELFWADMIRPLSPVDQALNGAHAVGFERMCRILAEENLAQATYQLPRAPSNADTLSDATRRFIQATFYGLMSIRLERGTFFSEPSTDPRLIEMPDRPRSRASSMPSGEFKRYAFIYELIFRKCIERAPSWLLGRGLARDDIRLGLLLTFADPMRVRKLLGDLHELRHSERSFETLGFVERIANGDFPAFRGDMLREYPKLSADIQLALLHATRRTSSVLRAAADGATRAANEAAIRSSTASGLSAKTQTRPSPGVDDLAQAVNSLISPNGDRAAAAEMVADFMARVTALTYADDSVSAGARFAKVAIDAFQALADEEEATRLCIDWLRRLRVGDEPLERLAKLGDRFAMQGGWNKRAFEVDVLTPLSNDLNAAGRTRHRTELISDFLLRYGEILAMKADKFDYRRRDGDEPEERLKAAVGLFAHAYGVFWVADRLRASAAYQDDSDPDWPLVSPRSMRYFVRVSLKMAKLVARVTSPPSEEGRAFDGLAQAEEFYLLARGRAEVFGRHQFHLPAERLNILLLLASAARVRATMRLRRQELGAFTAGAPYATVSANYLVDAERLWIQLGCHNSIAKRLLLERIKTTKAERANDHRRLSVDRDYQVLAQLSKGDAFWEDILRRITPST